MPTDTPSQSHTSRAAVALALAAIAVASFYFFPGHTWLGSDTQIYAPLLERLSDPTLFTRELITSRQHLGWTAYDEAAIVLHRVTSLPFETILTFAYLLFRGLGLWGVFLIAQSMGLSRRFALMVAGLYALGATVPGPAVFTVEYEPVPRGFAFSLILLGAGLAFRGRPGWATLAGSAALLCHAPTTLPFWLLFGVYVVRQRRWRLLAPPVAAAAILVLLWRVQPGGLEVQPVFGKVDSAWEAVLRLRAAYVWVSMWPPRFYAQYIALSLVSAIALWRLSWTLRGSARAVWFALPTFGLCSIAVSWLLLEGARWSLLPQLQPARYALLVTFTAVLLSATAAVRAAQARRYSEAFLWMALLVLLPLHGDLFSHVTYKMATTVLILAAAGTLALYLSTRPGKWAAGSGTAFLVAAMFAIPILGNIHNYPNLDTPDLDGLCAWAESTPKDAVFVFPYAGRGLTPGVFRARAKRALYVDWKAGGQANFFRDMGLEWQRRWQAVSKIPQDASAIDYLVLPPDRTLPGLTPEFRNGTFVVYHLR